MARVSPEALAKIGAARKGKPLSAETRTKISIAHKGKTLSPETRARMCAGQRRRWAKQRGWVAPVEVPGWVPFDLREKYLALAAEGGEEYAASEVRRLKREAAR